MQKLIIALVLCLVALPVFGAKPAAPAKKAVAKQVSTHIARPGVQMIVVDESLEQFAGMWSREISRRFPEAVAILCHGGSVVEGQWLLRAPFGDKQLMPATDLVKHYKQLYKGKTVVLLACNPSHLTLGVPGVYYSHSNVWCVPDRDVLASATAHAYFMKTNGEERPRLTGQERSQSSPDVIGSIFEFIVD